MKTTSSLLLLLFLSAFFTTSAQTLKYPKYSDYCADGKGAKVTPEDWYSWCVDSQDDYYSECDCRFEKAISAYNKAKKQQDERLRKETKEKFNNLEEERIPKNEENNNQNQSNQKNDSNSQSSSSEYNHQMQELAERTRIRNQQYENIQIATQALGDAALDVVSMAQRDRINNINRRNKRISEYLNKIGHLDKECVELYANNYYEDFLIKEKELRKYENLAIDNLNWLIKKEGELNYSKLKKLCSIKY